MKKQLLRISDYAIYGSQRFVIGFFQGFTTVTAAMVLTIGLYMVTAAWPIGIFGEERTVAFITNHPNLFICCMALFTIGTGGLAYWAYSRDVDVLHSDLRRRLAKHSKLFKAA